ncbi:hypothetical protein BOW41_12675, partial [Solemya velum gill symbiont]
MMKIIMLCLLYQNSNDLLIKPMIQHLDRMKFHINFLNIFHPMPYTHFFIFIIIYGPRDVSLPLGVTLLLFPFQSLAK